MNQQRITRHLSELARVAEATATHLSDEVAAVADLTLRTLRRGGTLYFCGNGGSAADSQHLAAEYVVRFARDRRALPALALTVDSSALTAAANDFGFDEIFARQVAALGRPGDLLFLHSTSGRSANLLRAAEVARQAGLQTVALLARDGGPLKDLVDVALVVPTEVTAHAQEIHIALGHAICDLVDEAWSTPAPDPAMVAALESLRRMEKAQTLWYRALASRAEDDDDAVLSERFNGLHADEQHHLSRITARLLELEVETAELRSVAAPPLPGDDWAPAVREREQAEVASYEAALEGPLDAETRAVLVEILESERHHLAQLGGKWMPA